MAELGVSQGVTFLTGELERLLEGLATESSESPGGVATDMDTDVNSPLGNLLYADELV